MKEVMNLLKQVLRLDTLSKTKPRRVLEVAGYLACLHAQKGQEELAQGYMNLARQMPDILKTDETFKTQHSTVLENFDIIDNQMILIEAAFLNADNADTGSPNVKNKHQQALTLLTKGLSQTRRTQFGGLQFLNAIKHTLAHIPEKRQQLKTLSELIKCKEKTAGQASLKHVVFVLDRSGSMGGGRIQAACKHMVNIFDNHCFAGDRISFIAFNDQVQIHLNNETKSPDQGRILAQATDCGSCTAFRDALKTAVAMSSKDNMTKYIVALTDGGDNSSSCSQQDIERSFAQATDCKLVIIGLMVDRSTNHVLQSIAHSCGKGSDGDDTGTYINAEGAGQELTEAFAEAAAKMDVRGQGIELESLDR
jgi:Mg-chelatase subunit ChlD